MLGIAFAAVMSFVSSCVLALIFWRSRGTVWCASLACVVGTALGYAIGWVGTFVAFLIKSDLPGFQFGGVYYSGSIVLVSLASVISTVVVYFICRCIEKRNK